VRQNKEQAYTYAVGYFGIHLINLIEESPIFSIILEIMLVNLKASHLSEVSIYFSLFCIKSLFLKAK
jgi:hypothetical protein